MVWKTAEQERAYSDIIEYEAEKARYKELAKKYAKEQEEAKKRAEEIAKIPSGPGRKRKPGEHYTIPYGPLTAREDPFYKFTHTTEAGEAAKVGMSPKVYALYKQARQEEYEKSILTDRESVDKYKEAMREAGRDADMIAIEEAFIKKKSKEPMTLLSYFASPSEWFGIGAVAETTTKGLVNLWEGKPVTKGLLDVSQGLVTGFTAERVRETKKGLKAGKTPEQIGLEYGTGAGLIAGGKMGLMMAGGGFFGLGAKAVGSTAMTGIYGAGVGLQYGETIKSPTKENIARSLVYSTPLLIMGGGKAVKTIKGYEPKMLRGEVKGRGKARPKLKLKQKPKPKVKVEELKTEMIRDSAERFQNFKYREYLSKSKTKAKMTYDVFSKDLGKKLNKHKSLFREAQAWMKKDIELKTGKRLLTTKQAAQLQRSQAQRVRYTRPGVRLRQRQPEPLATFNAFKSMKSAGKPKSTMKMGSLVDMSPLLGFGAVTKLASKTKQRQKRRTKTGLGMLQASRQRSALKHGQIQLVDMSPLTGFKTAQKPKTISPFRPPGRIGMRGRPRPKPPRETGRRLLISGPLVIWPTEKAKKKKAIMPGVSKRKARYSPSLLGVFAGRKAKRQPLATGFGVRPVVKRKKRKKR